jgi:hypothetical protein
MHCGFGTKRSRARLVAGGPDRGWVVQPPRYGTRGVRAQAAAGEDGGAEANKMTLEKVKEMLNKVRCLKLCLTYLSVTTT